MVSTLGKLHGNSCSLVRHGQLRAGRLSAQDDAPIARGTAGEDSERHGTLGTVELLCQPSSQGKSCASTVSIVRALHPSPLATLPIPWAPRPTRNA